MDAHLISAGIYPSTCYPCVSCQYPISKLVVLTAGRRTRTMPFARCKFDKTCRTKTTSCKFVHSDSPEWTKAPFARNRDSTANSSSSHTPLPSSSSKSSAWTSVSSGSSWSDKGKASKEADTGWGTGGWGGGFEPGHGPENSEFYGEN